MPPRLIHVTTFFYVLDIGSDVVLGIRFLVNGDVGWGQLTLLFVALPLTTLALVSCCRWAVNDNARKLFGLHRCVGPCFAALGLAPIAYQVNAENLAANGETDLSRWRASVAFMYEAILEAIPQLTLQLYIASKNNSIDWLSLLSIGSSLTTISFSGVNHLLVGYALGDHNRPRLTNTVPRRFVVTLIFMVWMFLHVATVAPSMAFRASLGGLISAASNSSYSTMGAKTT